MDKKLLSIIIPVYNTKQYLRECVDSAIDQDVDDVEIILVDDGSTDGSEEICDDYADKNSSVKVVHKPNKGLGSARNAGIRVAEGKYIYLLDSDDYIQPNSLGKVIGSCEENDLDICFFSASILVEDNEKHRNIYERKKGPFDTVFTGAELVRKQMDNNEYVTSVCLRVMRREFLLQNGFEFCEEHIHEDEDYAFMSALLAEKAMQIRDDLYVRRFRAGSIMTNRDYAKSFSGSENTLHSLLKFMNDERCTDEMKPLCERRILYGLRHFYINAYIKMDIKNRLTYRDRIKRNTKQLYGNINIRSGTINLFSIAPVMASFYLNIQHQCLKGIKKLKGKDTK